MVLILGAKGMLGGELLKVFGSPRPPRGVAGDAAIGWDREDVDVTQAENLKFKIQNLKPTVIINCVAYNDVDGAESNQELAFKLNAEPVKNLSEIANTLDIPLVHFSTNYVFDGEAGEYNENAAANPLSVYARSKYQGEQNLLNICKKPYLVRTSVIFGTPGTSTASKKSFIQIMLGLSEKTATIKAVHNEASSLAYAADLAKGVKNLIEEKRPYGIYHIVNSGFGSWYEIAKEIFSITGKQVELIPVSADEFPRKADRPHKAILLNTKLPPLRPWQEALREYLKSY